MKETLVKFGFSDRQAMVYIYLLQNHDQPAYNIAEETRIPRATVYKILDELKADSYVSSWIKNGVKHFSVENPEMIRRLLKVKEQMISEILPDMMTMFKSDLTYPTAKLYEGKEGVKQVFENILEYVKARKLKRIYAYSDRHLTDQLPEYFRDWRKRRIKLDVFTQLIVPYGTPLDRDYASDDHRETRVMTRDFPIGGGIDICGSYIAFFSFKEGNIFAVTIESPIISELLTKFFIYIWDTLEPAKIIGHN